MRSSSGIAMTVLLLLGGAAPPAGAVQTPEPLKAVVSWSACPPAAAGQPSLDDFACANLRVPLDHARPDGRKITLGMVKHAASRNTPKGTIFFNPGGPGDQGSVFLPALLGGFGTDLVRDFDIVSWDPRGMGGLSSPTVQCFPTMRKAVRIFDDVSFPPLTTSERKGVAVALGRMNRRCGGSDLALLRHVATADSARDLDAMREALGLEKLDYYGTSYGTFLGATYAAMFPGRYRHMVLDGAIDPLAWTRARGQLTTFNRAGSGAASARALRTFLRMCGTRSRQQCAFSAGSPATTFTKYDRLLRAAKGGLRTPDGTVTANDIVSQSVENLYLIEPGQNLPQYGGWTASAKTLQNLWELSGVPVSAATTGETGRQHLVDTYRGPERQWAVICGESPNPSTSAPYFRQAQRSMRWGVGSASWTWSSYCVDWPVRAASAYLGPWNTAKRPIVVIGTTGDPATPYSNAVRTSRLLPNARLITVKGQGHTALANPSSCVQQRVAAYFLADQLPGPDMAACRQDARPFAD